MVDGRLRALEGVAGSMIGEKLKDGQPTGELVLTLIVREKRPLSDIAPENRIPARIRVGRSDLTTDVVEIAQCRREAAVFPTNGALLLTDKVRQGTLTTMARSRFGVWGISCAHALKGLDRDPNTASEVYILSQRDGNLLAGRTTGPAAYDAGAGLSGDYGFSDAALFSLEHPDLASRAQAAPVTPMAAPSIRQVVEGHARSGRKTGTVSWVEQRYDNLKVDVVVKVSSEGTYVGDSGMLWRAEDGAAVAIHARGDGPDGKPSGVSMAMDARRAAKRLAVKFVDG